MWRAVDPRQKALFDPAEAIRYIPLPFAHAKVEVIF